MFELGARIQVMKRGVFFPARANKLYDLYRIYGSLGEIDEKNSTVIQEKYFRRSYEEIFNEMKSQLSQHEVEKAEQHPKQKMAIVFKWYLQQTINLAIEGNVVAQVDYQVYCGPAMGSFNQWVKGTVLEQWRNRYVDDIGLKLMTETAKLLQQRAKQWSILFSDRMIEAN
jgi:trans-AT polyketide synthase/acyltransferase/oxidoreductase domain-containing protein